MKWLTIKDDGYPDDLMVLTFSEVFRDKPGLAFRLMFGRQVIMCREVTHYRYLVSPQRKP